MSCRAVVVRGSLWHLVRQYSSGKVPNIYTRTGDKGTSAAFTGERRPKDDQMFHALGAADELSSLLGLAASFCEESSDIAQRIQTVQCVLQDIASCIATPVSSARNTHLKLTQFDEGHVVNLEHWIDKYTDELPPLKNFILPSGGKASCTLHVARAVCRRAEREVAPLVRDGQMAAAPARYLNRLSDFLFTTARFAAHTEGKEEHIYIRPSVSATEKADDD